MKTHKTRLICLSKVLVGRARDTSRSCRTGGDRKEGLVCACADCNAYGKEGFSSRLVSGEAFVIIEEEIGSSRGKERLLSVKSVHAHKLYNDDEGSREFYVVCYRIFLHKH